MADSTLGMDGESPIKIHRGGGRPGRMRKASNKLLSNSPIVVDTCHPYVLVGQAGAERGRH